MSMVLVYSRIGGANVLIVAGDASRKCQRSLVSGRWWCIATTTALEASLDDKMPWYIANHSLALSHNDQHLINFTRDDLPSMPLHAKKEWV
jgi:hypothetical protein